MNDIYSIVLPLLDKHAPLEQIKVRRDTAPLYLADDTRAAMRARDRARADGNYGRYKVLRNRVVRLVKRDRAQTTHKRLLRASNPGPEAWKLATSLTRPRRPLPLLAGQQNNQSSANALNHFYIEKVEKLRERMPPPVQRSATNPLPTLEGSECLSLHCIGIKTVKKCIRSLSSTNAIGDDGIPVAFWKAAVPLAVPLMHLCNASIKHGKVPKAFKSAVLHPIQKRGKSAEELASYRPVAVLPAVSKVLERVVSSQIIDELEARRLLPFEQHGFRSGRSTVTALASSTWSWGRAIASGNLVGISAYDYSAAFDTVSASTVLKGFSELGADSGLLSWVKSYMTGGAQKVNWNGALSSILEVRHGLRQGSICGPLFFIIVTHALPFDLAEDLLHKGGTDSTQCSGGSMCYADDTNNDRSAKRADLVVSGLNASAVALTAASGRLELALNPQKTQLLYSGPKKLTADAEALPVHVNNSLIEPQKSIEILGFTLDTKLSPEPTWLS